ncbi:MAG: hypothetical protein MGAcid_12290 [uncultured Acidilobus sp. MG]|nr:MAG: hypothetical protein MGAcid_12290 [uncultured Acidilobus sp. MG]
MKLPEPSPHRGHVMGSSLGLLSLRPTSRIASWTCPESRGE